MSFKETFIDANKLFLFGIIFSTILTTIILIDLYIFKLIMTISKWYAVLLLIFFYVLVMGSMFIIEKFYTEDETM